MERNDYRRLVTGRGLASTVLGGELVFGFGAGGAGPYAELTTEVVRVEDGWRLGAPRGSTRATRSPSRPARDRRLAARPSAVDG